MSLAVFGLFLMLVLAALCWKNGRSIATAILAVMLGLVIAGSSGALSGVSASVVGGLRTGLDSVGQSLFGGGR